MDELKLIREGGVAGGGGAGFPTWKKLSSPAEYLLINGAECEPLLLGDQYLMEHQAQALVAAVVKIGEVIGAKHRIIALKDHYHPQIDALNKAIKELNADVSLHEMPSCYPVGDEQAVVYECTGRVVPPQGLPGMVGCTVMSVTTAIESLMALSGHPVTQRLCTVVGEVNKPGLYWAPVGTPISELIKAAGGLTVRGARYIMGGPMMGRIVPEGADPVITRIDGGLLVFPPNHRLINDKEITPEHIRNRAKSSCIQCRMCTDLCPRYLTGHRVEPHRVMRRFALYDELTPESLLCMECGLCELYSCPMGLSPRKVQVAQKAALRAQGAQPDKNIYPEHQEHRSYRQVPSERLAARIDVTRYMCRMPKEVAQLDVNCVRVPLKQHIGAPAVACVSVGDQVAFEQTIGRMAEGALGADVHASIAGRVTQVTDTFIEIVKEGAK